MSDREFGQWVTAHVTATGADPVRLTELLWANREVIVTRLSATYAELCECTDRLFEGGRVPQFPNEHPNAIVKELKALRLESNRREESKRLIEDHTPKYRRADCRFFGICCNGNDFPRCQEIQLRWERMLKERGSATGGIGTGGF